MLAGAALVLALAAFWLTRAPAKPEVRIVAHRELRPEAPVQALPAPVPVAPVLAAHSAEELFAELSRSTARIVVYDVAGRAVGLGSGVVTGIGAVITNCHVATAGGSLSVKVGGEQYFGQRRDRRRGIRPLPPFRDGAHRARREHRHGRVPQDRTEGLRDRLAAGPGAARSATASSRACATCRRAATIKTTAPISPGSSGGPLFDAYGRLVGIMTFQHRSGQNLNFAVPADWIANIRSRSATNPLTEAMSKSMAPN